jgi:elongator complex protein 3
MDYHQRLISLILDGSIGSKEELQKRKIALCRELGLDRVPANSETLAHVEEAMLPQVVPLLRRKPVRTLSGVAVVAVMTSPAPCPHGRCIYCPGGVEKGTPQSYTGKEPAARRGERNDFDPYAQTADRLRQLAAIGHPTDKVDLIIMGGTFTSRSREYQLSFVKGCFDAMNASVSADIEEAHSLNTLSRHRCIGLTVETRPDCLGEQEVRQTMELGATRVELGVQILDDRVLEGVERGHGVKEVELATKRAKESGLKVCYHLMPGLPGSSPTKDLECFRKVFEDPRFRPDMLKIYPTLVLGGTPLHEKWLEGEYIPYDTEQAVELLAQMKSLTPRYVRIQRIQRDIPVPLIEAGVDKGHLRQLVKERMLEKGLVCSCVRCREVGLKGIQEWEEPEPEVIEYEASGGRETFLALNLPSSDSLIAYLRLRMDGSPMARVRELKVFGPLIPLGRRDAGWQHRGYGRHLLEEAERLALERGCESISVTSGVGVRPYYRSLGYSLEAPYMVKRLRAIN